MQTLDEKKDYLQRVFRASIGKGICRTVKEFADVLGVDKTGLSSAMNGNPRNLTDRLVRKVENYAELNRLFSDDPSAPAQAEPSRSSGIYIPRETLDLYTNLSETCRNLSAIVARMGVAAPALQSFAPAQKNSTTDPLP